MKNFILFILIGIFLVLIPQSSSAQWVQTASPQGGSIIALMANGATILAVAQEPGAYGPSGKIYRSQDYGKSWTLSDSGIDFVGYYSIIIACFAQFGSSILFGYDNSASGLYRSSNNGLIWDSCGSYIPFIIYSLITKGNTIFAGTTSGVYLSNDTGKTWIGANSGLPVSSAIFSLTSLGTKLIAGTNQGIFLSSNNGKNWASAISGQLLAMDTIFSLVSIGSSVFAGTNNGLYRSSDSGSIWANSGIGLPANMPISAMAENGSVIFVGYKNSGLYFSSNNGTTWVKANTGFARTPVLSMVANGPKVFVGTDGGGIIVTADSGKTWSPTSSGLPFTAQINSFFANGANIFSGTPMGIYLSINNGNSWSLVNSGLPENNQSYSFTSTGSTIFVGTAGYGVYATTNNGATWNVANSGLTNNYISSMKSNGTFLYAGTNHGVFISSDTGKSWSLINHGIADIYETPPPIAIGPVDTSVTSLAVGNGGLFALVNYGYGSKISYTLDNGQNWNPGRTFPCCNSGSSVVAALVANGNNLFIGSYQVSKIYYYGLGVSRSSDNGVTFAAANNSLTSNLFVADIINCGKSLFIGTSSGVFVSNSADSNWKALNSGLPSPPSGNLIDSAPTFIQHLAVNDGYLFASINGKGIWRAPLSSVALQLTNIISLDQVYLKVSAPSRLNSNVAVSFSLPHAEQVSVKVYNLSGREIATVVNKYLGAGTHGISWNMKDAAPGCYAVKLQAGPHEFVKKIPFP
jgi:photosystem II stability/assembly factor-like uncharacterized protein